MGGGVSCELGVARTVNVPVGGRVIKGVFGVGIAEGVGGAVSIPLEQV